MLKIATFSGMDAQRAQVAEQAKQVREEAGLKSGNGVSLVVLHNHTKTKDASEGGKAPPSTLIGKVTGIKTLARAGTNDHYRVDAPDTIALPCFDKKAIKTAKDALAKAKGEEAVNKASEALIEAQKPLDWYPIKDGDMVYIQTFEKAALDRIGDLFKVKCIGVGGEYSTYNGKIYNRLSCQSVMPLGAGEPVYTSLSKTVNLNQQPVRLPAELGKSESHLIFFCDYMRENPTEGPVVQRFVSNSTDEKDYHYAKEGEAPKCKMTLTLWQKQESSPGYPGGDYYMTALILDDEKDKRTLLRKTFGINDALKFSKIMAANPVPALSFCSLNVDSTASQNMGRNPATDSGTLVMWGNKTKFFLREYLLQNCPQVSFTWVKTQLGVDADAEDRYATVLHDNPNNICRLNQSNLVSKGNRYIFINDMVVNASNFSGNLSHLKDQGCEWRVMHSRVSDPQNRAQEAQMSFADAEKMLSSIPIYVIYAVVPFPAQEEQVEEEEDEEVEAPQAPPTPKREEPPTPTPPQSPPPAKKTKTTNKKSVKK